MSGSTTLLSALGTEWIDISVLEKAAKLDPIVFKNALAAALRSKKIITKRDGKQRLIRKNCFTAEELDKHRHIKDIIKISDYYQFVSVTRHRESVELGVRRPHRRIILQMPAKVAEEIGELLSQHSVSIRGEESNSR